MGVDSGRDLLSPKQEVTYHQSNESVVASLDFFGVGLVWAGLCCVVLHACKAVEVELFNVVYTYSMAI